MKVLIIGSRSLEDFNLSEYVPTETELIISGGAGGVDTSAEKYADENRISKLILRPDYKRYGRCAPIKRNEQMVELADRIIAVWDGRSKGTEHTIKYAQKRNKDITVILDTISTD